MKRYSLFLRSAVNGGATAASVQYNLTALNSRIRPDKKYRLTVRQFSFSGAVWNTGSTSISVSIPEFVQNGMLVSASTTNTLTSLQGNHPLFLVHNDQGNNNRILAYDNFTDTGVDGYFTSNIITVRIIDESTLAAPALTININYSLLFTLDELDSEEK